VLEPAGFSFGVRYGELADAGSSPGFGRRRMKRLRYARLLGEQFRGEKISCGVVSHSGFFHFAKGRFELIFVRGAVVQKPLEFVQFARILAECCSVGTPDRFVRFHAYKTIFAAKGFAFSPHVFG
jgi:hypothetical protein